MPRVVHFFSSEERWKSVQMSKKILTVKDHAVITKIMDGSTVGVWVAPREARDFPWHAHFFSGVGDRTHYVEFDADDKELTIPHGVIKVFFSHYQRIIPCDVLDLTGRNPIFGKKNSRAMPFKLEAFQKDPTKDPSQKDLTKGP